MIRLSFCALLFLLGSELNSQTTTPQNGSTTGERHGAWKVIDEENFEDRAALFKTGSPRWVSDTYQNTDEFSDGGGYFKGRGVTPPVAFRAEGPFGKDGWLSVAAYSRSSLTKFSDLFLEKRILMSLLLGLIMAILAGLLRYLLKPRVDLWKAALKRKRAEKKNGIDNLT